jgi:prephenate dehydratase
MRNHRVAIQGIVASYHDLAARKIYGEDLELVECSTFKETCEAVVNNRADYAIMAIENSTAGSILSNYNLIEDYNLKVIGELYVRIQFHLMALPGVSLKEIEVINSHPMAISQCQPFLLEHANIRVVEGNDTARCARDIKDKQLRNTAAIGNEVTANTYGMEILASNIESNKKNYTRFLVITKGSDVVENPDKASISIQLLHDPGTLAKALTVLGDHRINLTKIQSVPIVGNLNEYNFHLDLEWNDYDQYKAALAELVTYCKKVKILGEYKRSKIEQ